MIGALFTITVGDSEPEPPQADNKTSESNTIR